MPTKMFRWSVISWCALCLGALVLRAQQAPPPASTQPALSDRQASILLQLSDAEANIKVINQALARTGYKVGLAYDRIENSEKANELMDRNGGGPVRWDEFKIKAPLMNVAKPPGEWQTYDITFHAARREGDRKVKNATITVYWNGELVQDNTEIPHSTLGGSNEENTPGPIRLQWHNHHVKFRNIWIVPMKD